MLNPDDPDTYMLDNLLYRARAIWGTEEGLTLSDVAVRAGVDFGKLCRLARGATKDRVGDHAAAMAELEAVFGNIIFSMIRWAGALGLSPRACIERAIGVQERFARENPDR